MIEQDIHLGSRWYVSFRLKDAVKAHKNHRGTLSVYHKKLSFRFYIAIVTFEYEENL